MHIENSNTEYGPCGQTVLTKNEIEAIDKRIDRLEREIKNIELELEAFDLLAGKLESARTQLTRAICMKNRLLIKDAVQFPTFIGIE